MRFSCWRRCPMWSGGALYDNPLVMFVGVAVIVWLFDADAARRNEADRAYIEDRLRRRYRGAGADAHGRSRRASQPGGVSALAFDPSKIVPDFSSVDTLVIFASFVLAYMGVEASASHVNELRNPQARLPARDDRPVRDGHLVRRHRRHGGCDRASHIDARRQHELRRYRGVSRHLRDALRHGLARVRGGGSSGARRSGGDLRVDRGPLRALLETEREGIIPRRSPARTNMACR